MFAVNKFKAMAVVLAFMVPMSMAAAPKSGKVRLVIGDVQYQKTGKIRWNPLRIDAKVAQKDRIKTDVESTVSIAFPDGSVVSVGERAEVEFTELVYSNGEQKTEVNLMEGVLEFDVQKQKGPKSAFRFKTGNATCSIRGTDGVVSVTKSGNVMGSLNSGAMDMEEGGQMVSVAPNQFAALRKGKAPVKGEAKNAGDPKFMKELATVLDDSTKTDEEIMSAAKSLDDKYEKIKAELRAKYNCKFEDLPTMTDQNSIVVNATCTPGIDAVVIGAETAAPTDGKLSITPSWSEGSFGPKKFVAKCHAEDNWFECARLQTEYRVIRTPAFGGSDEKKCQVKFSTTGFEENAGPVKLKLGDKILNEIMVGADTAGVLKLQPGTFVYTLDAEADLPSEGKVTKKLRCYPQTNVSVNIKGKTTEIIKKFASQGSFVYPEIEFSLKNVLNNDPGQVHSVEVFVGGKPFSIESMKSEDGSLAYKSTVKIPRNKTSEVNVVTTMENGDVFTAKKVFIIH